MKAEIDRIIRVALYIRVSTEEQALHGYSLQAQEDELLHFAKEKKYKVVGTYRDEGFSARKPALKRKVMQELLDDVRAGKIDRILFIKLDRWFRNVWEYHQVQAVLDENNVTWQATMEDYNTATADGRLKVNIMLSVAENEADRTSERIKFVFNSKVNRGEYPYGRVPIGYKAEIVDGLRKLVKDPELEAAITAFWEYALKYNSVRRAGFLVNAEYGTTRAAKEWLRTGKLEIYCGTFEGIPDFCPAYVSRENWKKIQDRKNLIKKAQAWNVYLFSGLITCPSCGHTLKATYKSYPNDRSIKYNAYRCNHGRDNTGCTYRSSVSEKKTEKYLLEHLREMIEEYISETEVGASSKKKKRIIKFDVAKAKEQLRRLNVAYFAGNMPDDEYTAMAAKLKEDIAKALESEYEAEKAPDIGKLRAFLDTDFEAIYRTLEKDDQRRLWRSIIKEIRVEDNHVVGVTFNV